MSDKWRFDPLADYTSDDYGTENGGHGNFQRFKKKKNKNNDCSDDNIKGKKKQKHHSSNWR